MSTRQILTSFEIYQKSKLNFLQHVYEYCLKKGEIHIDQLIQMNIVHHMIPLLNDTVPHVQSLAMTTTAKLCSISEVITKDILQSNILIQMGEVYEEKKTEYKRNLLYLIRAMSQHNRSSAQVFQQTCDILRTSLNTTEDNVLKETILSTLRNIASQNKELSNHILDLDIFQQIQIGLQQTINLAVASTQLFKILCRLSDKIAGLVVENDTLKHLTENLQRNDSRLTKHTLMCLSEIAKYSLEFAEKLMDPRIICKAILHTSHVDNGVRHSAATLLRELTKHNVVLCTRIIQHGALVGLINMITATDGNDVSLPAVMCLGYTAAHSDHLALAIIQSNGLDPIIGVLSKTTNPACLSAALWCIEQIGKHSVAHVNHFANTNLFGKILSLYLSPSQKCPEIKERCLSTLLNTLNKCMNISELELLLYETPKEILLPVLKQMCKIFPVDPRARRVFVTTGGLKRVQNLNQEPGTELSETIALLNAFFPEDIVRYYSPKYPEELLSKVEKFTPKLQENLVCTKSSVSLISVETASEQL